MRSVWFAALAFALASPAAAQQKQPESAPRERVALAPNTGGHSRPVVALTFTPDGRHLVTISDFEVMVWSVRSGELERTWRLPGSISRLAASPDNRTIAVARWIGGNQNFVWLLDLVTGASRTVTNLPCGQYEAFDLNFSPDGTRLAWNTWYRAGLFEVKSGRHLYVIADPHSPVQFNKEGTQIFLGANNNNPRAPFQVFDLPPLAGNKLPVEVKKPRISLEDHKQTRGDAWAPDGSRFAGVSLEKANEILLWGADGKRERVKGKDGKLRYRTIVVPGLPAFPPHATPPLLKFVGSDKVLLANVENGKVCAALVDLDSGKVLRANKIAFWQRSPPILAATPDGEMLAAYSGPGFQATLFNLATNKWARRFGPNQFRPVFLSWGKDSRSIAWGLEGKVQPKVPLAQNLHGGLRLETTEPLHPGDFQGFRSRSEPKGWRVDHEGPDKRQSKKAGWTFLRDGKRTELDIDGGMLNHLCYADANGNPRVILCSSHHIRGGFWLFDGDTGKRIATIKDYGYVHELVVSPDKKYLLVSEGGQVLDVYRIDGRPAHLLSILVSGQDWVAWTPSGHYAATPVGERRVGWTAFKERTAPLTFYPMERFRKALLRPDVIQRVLGTGSVGAAVKAANAAQAPGTQARDVSVAQLLPPRATLTVIDAKAGQQVKVKASAVAAVASQPVTALRLLVDGRPLPNREGLSQFTPGQPEAQAEWTVTLPEGKHHLAVLARGPDASAVSAPVDITLAGTRQLPVLHMLAIGVDKYVDPALTLQFAAADADALAKAFARECKGKLFSEVRAHVLLDADAKRDAVLQRLDAIRKQAKDNDLFVVFFAGHGVKTKDQFYLLTVEAQVADLANTALSGRELRKGLSEFPCQVLLLLDACHSAGFGEGRKLQQANLRPATDDATRALTDDEIAVAVMCAAMGSEKAQEKDGHGLFTKALLDALARGPGVPRNPFDQQVYVHHLQSYVFDYVSQRSGDRQHPFLSMPWVVTSFPVR